MACLRSGVVPPNNACACLYIAAESAAAPMHALFGACSSRAAIYNGAHALFGCMAAGYGIMTGSLESSSSTTEQLLVIVEGLLAREPVMIQALSTIAPSVISRVERILFDSIVYAGCKLTVCDLPSRAYHTLSMLFATFASLVLRCWEGCRMRAALSTP